MGKLKTLCDEIQESGGEAILAPIDIQDYESVDNLALSVKNKFGCLDILVSVAALLGGLGPVQEYEPAVWKEVMHVNLFANWYLIKHFDALLKSAPAGRAVFVTSEAARSLLNYSYFAPYAASKVALEAMVQVYAVETKHSKLCANIVYPCSIDSNIYSQIFSAQEQSKLLAPDSVTDKVQRQSECSASRVLPAYFHIWSKKGNVRQSNAPMPRPLRLHQVAALSECTTFVLVTAASRSDAQVASVHRRQSARQNTTPPKLCQEKGEERASQRYAAITRSSRMCDVC
ncbi:hypothetical protein GH714_042849 [Hevea brasiliensis]|uniref:Uncharacterized protein n=1 Tax=Hevea brasiliensis TaxID=3981 RepID=A0A6A6K0P5_HEVBR|nr:hypothetical protein GH714_042849 [Hevea brasiliensis]